MNWMVLTLIRHKSRFESIAIFQIRKNYQNRSYLWCFIKKNIISGSADLSDNISPWHAAWFVLILGVASSDWTAEWREGLILNFMLEFVQSESWGGGAKLFQPIRGTEFFQLRCAAAAAENWKANMFNTILIPFLLGKDERQIYWHNQGDKLSLWRTRK